VVFVRHACVYGDGRALHTQTGVAAVWSFEPYGRSRGVIWRCVAGGRAVDDPNQVTLPGMTTFVVEDKVRRREAGATSWWELSGVRPQMADAPRSVLSAHDYVFV